MKTLAFAIVVVACLFTSGNHDTLLNWSIFGLWFSAIFESEIGESIVKISRKGESK
jgi:hypothetical protein